MMMLFEDQRLRLETTMSSRAAIALRSRNENRHRLMIKLLPLCAQCVMKSTELQARNGDPEFYTDYKNFIKSINQHQSKSLFQEVLEDEDDFYDDYLDYCSRKFLTVKSNVPQPQSIKGETNEIQVVKESFNTSQPLKTTLKDRSTYDNGPADCYVEDTPILDAMDSPPMFEERCLQCSHFKRNCTCDINTYISHFTRKFSNRGIPLCVISEEGINVRRNAADKMITTGLEKQVPVNEMIDEQINVVKPSTSKRHVDKWDNFQRLESRNSNRMFDPYVVSQSLDDYECDEGRAIPHETYESKTFRLMKQSLTGPPSTQKFVNSELLRLENPLYIPIEDEKGMGDGCKIC